MAKTSVKNVRSVEEYLDWIQESSDPSNELAFRGQRNAKWKLNCSAARRMSKLSQGNSKIWGERLIQYHKVHLLRPARRLGFNTNGQRELGDLEVLANLQHLGAATCLLDFTRDCLVALWMACEGSRKPNAEPNGKIFFVNLSDRTLFRTVTQDEARSNDNIGRFLLNELEDDRRDMCWYWEPPMIDDVAPRILRQHSIFLLGHAFFPNHIARVIQIQNGEKNSILADLSIKHNITSVTIQVSGRYS